MKFMICGVGSIGLRHLRNLRTLGYSDIILYRTGKSSILDDSGATSGLKVYYDLDEALLEKPDICVISNPTSLHVSTAIKCAEMGCHLFIEKPLSNTLKDLEKLEQIVQRNNLITMITYQFRFHPHFKILHDVFGNDKLVYGKAIYASTEWSEYLPDWHPWEDYKQSYSARDDLGGGVFLTQIHPINYLSYLFGPIKNIVKKMYCSGALGISVEDVADTLISFESDLVGHVHVDYLQKPRVHQLKIVTDKGRFEWDCHKNTLVFLTNEGDREIFSNDGFERNDMFLSMLDYFINCVSSNKETNFDLNNAIYELKMLLDHECEPDGHASVVTEGSV